MANRMDDRRFMGFSSFARRVAWLVELRSAPIMRSSAPLFKAKHNGLNTLRSIAREAPFEWMV